MGVGNLPLQLGQVTFQDVPESPALCDRDPAPSFPEVSGGRLATIASPQQVVGPSARLVQVFERPDLGLSPHCRGCVRERSKEPDPRFTGAVVLRPGTGRPEMHHASAGEKGTARGTDKTATVI
jgi:hypothetical protein